MSLDVLVSVCAVLLGAVLIYAGCSKLRDVQAFATSINAYGIVPRRIESVLGYGIAVAEIGIGSMLLFGLWTRWTLMAVALLFVLFFGANTWAYVNGREVECHCFGVRDKASIRFSAIRSGCLFLLAAALAWFGDTSLPNVGDQARALLVGAGIGTLTILATMLIQSIRRLVFQLNLQRN